MREYRHCIEDACFFSLARLFIFGGTYFCLARLFSFCLARLSSFGATVFFFFSGAILFFFGATFFFLARLFFLWHDFLTRGYARAYHELLQEQGYANESLAHS